MNMIQLEQTNSHYLLSIPQALMSRAKKIKPRQWDHLGLVWKYPRDKDTYELLLDEFENDIEKVVITPPNHINNEESQKLAKKNKTISDLQKKVKLLESNLSLMKDQRDQYLSSIIQLTKKVEHLKNEDNDLEKNIKKFAKLCIGNDHLFSNIIEEIEFDNTLPIELQKKLSNILKSKLNSKNPSIDFIDLISLAKDKKLLSNDAIHLLHIIRRQRNLFAHNSIEPKTRLMRVIYVIAAFSLLSSEF